MYDVGLKYKPCSFLFARLHGLAMVGAIVMVEDDVELACDERL